MPSFATLSLTKLNFSESLSLSLSTRSLPIESFLPLYCTSLSWFTTATGKSPILPYGSHIDPKNIQAYIDGISITTHSATIGKTLSTKVLFFSLINITSKIFNIVLIS